MVLAGVGIDHQKLVDLGKRYFSVPKSEAQTMDKEAIEVNKAVWAGGAVTVRSWMMVDVELSWYAF